MTASTAVASASTTRAAAPGTYLNPVLDAGPEVDHGDPFVLEFLGEYFLYYSGPTSIAVWRSSDLVTWEPAGTALTGAPAGHWAEVELWAPEVVYRDGEFVMYVAATRRGGPARTSGKAAGADGGDDEQRRQGVARSRSPLGPFVWDDTPLVDEWSIDAHPFLDDDGSEWLFYNVRNEETRHADGTLGCGNVVDRVLADGRLAGEPVPVAYPSEPWEAHPEGGQYWNEAPFTMKRHGRYYQMYSGGFFGGDGYSLGVTVADSVTGPWTKASRHPIFTSGAHVSGPGHHCVTVAPDGVTPYAVYHGYVGDGYGRKVHADPLFWAGDGPQLGLGSTRPTSPSGLPQALPPKPVYDADVAPFHLRAWMEGAVTLVDGVGVALDGPVPCLVEAAYDGEALTVRRNGAVVARRQGPARPQLHCGTVLHSALTSRLDVDAEHVLAAGEEVVRAWGGGLPVSCSLAVSGRVRVELGDEVLEVDAAPDAYELVTLSSPAGAAQLRVTAVGPARVADVVLAARAA
ncbi:glycoside hydrolase family 43 protein [Motilibacter deserti]|uniref:Family 43 glycosylhydrolase n=1 Tax=Motilibacter deserti TaxID=2714956 RepID=A0ABX0GZE9_9ACTN|nr:family 43 glycosylhydrolase [Motilibacter deserti]